MTIEHPEYTENKQQELEITSKIEKLLKHYYSTHDKKDEFLIQNLAETYIALTGRKYVHQYVQEERKA